MVLAAAARDKGVALSKPQNYQQYKAAAREDAYTVLAKAGFGADTSELYVMFEKDKAYWKRFGPPNVPFPFEGWTHGSGEHVNDWRREEPHDHDYKS